MGLVENLFDKKVSHPSIFEQKTTYTRSQVLVVSTLEKSEVPCFIRIHHKHNLKNEGKWGKYDAFFLKLILLFVAWRDAGVESLTSKHLLLASKRALADVLLYFS